jgi:UDP-galactopyranose mutase
MSSEDFVQPIVSPVAWPAGRAKGYDVMVVGAGFAGAVMAERLARGSGKKVLVVDRRPHIAGTAFDYEDRAGAMVRSENPCIFKSSRREVFDYLSQFTAWHPVDRGPPAGRDGMLVQVMPAEGCTHMFERMLDHPNIDLLLGMSFAEAREAYAHDSLVYTGRIDEYFGYRLGRLPECSLPSLSDIDDVGELQSVAVVDTDRPEDQALLRRYEALALVESGVTFVGPLALQWRYAAEQIVGQALATYRRLVAPKPDITQTPQFAAGKRMRAMRAA